MELNLMGKIVLVTGSSRGIGVEIALAFAREGAHVAVHYYTSRDGAEKTVGRIKEMGGEAAAFQADVSKREDVSRLFEEIKARFGTVDILVNNAANVIGGPIVSYPEEKYRLVMGSELDGAFFCTQEALKIMLKKRSGKIVNISSTSGTGAFPETAAYSAAKAGIIGLTRAVAIEVASQGINVNAVAPGYVETPLVAKLSQSKSGKKILDPRQIPLGRLAKMSEIAAAVVFLSSSQADYITGEVLTVGGGLMTAMYDPEQG
jgi:3-oxoacyl-[acyl-carrier protein] reductase